MAWKRETARLLGVVAAMLAVLASPAARAEWWEAQTSHFVVYSESDKGAVEKFATTLERFDNALRTLQVMPVPGHAVGPVHRVKFYRTADTDNISVFEHDSGSGVAGFYLTRAVNPDPFVTTRECISTSNAIQEVPTL